MRKLIYPFLGILALGGVGCVGLSNQRPQISPTLEIITRVYDSNRDDFAEKIETLLNGKLITSMTDYNDDGRFGSDEVTLYSDCYPNGKTLNQISEQDLLQWMSQFKKSFPRNLPLQLAPSFQDYSEQDKKREI